MIEIWQQSLEYKTWGLNVLTGIVLISFLYLTFELWALWKQNTLIWQKKSGEAVSIIWFAYYGAHAFAGIIYGLETRSITVAVTSLLLGLIHIPIVVGLWKFKQKERSLHNYEKVLILMFPLIIPIIVLLPMIDMVYSLFTIGILGGLMHQPYIMWRTKSRGVLEIRLVFIYLGSSLIWSCIGFYLYLPVFMIFSPLSTLCLLAMLYFWLQYPQTQKAVYSDI